MKKTKTILFVLIMALMSQSNFAQSDLQVFGFFQGSVSKLKGGYSAIADVPAMVNPTGKLVLSEKKDDYTNPSIQQLNLFFRKELNEKFTAWVNFEILGSYNSGNSWGSFSLEEAWVNYQMNNAFNVKAGLLIPRFAYLNEIKNRMPLLPYITRPLVYESSNKTINYSHFVPERAFVQAYGYIPVSDFTFDYAVFAGPSENSYISGSGATGGTSVDTTNFKLFGGRVGAKYSDLRFGVSFTSDKDNQQATILEDVSRTRFAFDLGYSLYNFFFDAEYIAVNLKPKNSTKNQNKLFYYGTLGYNITDDLFAYGSYSYLKDENDNILNSGMKGLIFGMGFKPLESVVIKGSYAAYYAKSSFDVVINPNIPAVNTNVDIDYKSYQIAVSVLF